MDKVLYLLWGEDEPSQSLCDRVRATAAPSLLELGVDGLQLNLDDAEVEQASMRMAPAGPAPAAFVHVWRDASGEEAWAQVDDVIAEIGGRTASYRVEHHEPLRNAAPDQLGTRTTGYVNVALLRRPARLGPEAWRTEWLDRHTAVAIDTQSTRRYVQNVVLARRSVTGPPLDGVVEELFPPAALTDFAAMFDAVDDDAALAERFGAMNESVARFLDVADLCVVPTSEYVLRRVV